MSERDEDRGNMDRKFGRQSSVPPKGNNGSESKKDNGNGQKFPKYNKHKDHGNKNDQQSNRKPQPQKSRYMDKRPRSRGVHNGSNRDEVNNNERADPEYGSVQSWGHKKSNMSHLLNFHFEPRDFHNSGRGGGRARYSGSGTGRHNWHRGSRYNKEHYLQANFQFIVRDTGDYTAHTADPDILVAWELIEQIRIYGSGQTACPICLYEPKAAKITHCGHIYCWSCILHYLSLGEKDWRRCPICYDAILQKDLKSVKIIKTHSYKVGETITLQLMKRIKGSCQTMPTSQWTDTQGQLYNLTDDVSIQYAKLLKVSVEEVQKIVDEEKLALEFQLAEEGAETLEGSYVKAAMELLKKREISLMLTSLVQEDVEGQLRHMTLEDETKQVRELLQQQAKRTVVYQSAFLDEEEELVPVSNDEPVETSSNDATQCKPTPELQTSQSLPTDADSERRTSESSTGSASGQITEEHDGPIMSVVTEEGVQQVPVSDVTDQLALPQDQLGEGAVPKKNLNYFYFFQAVDGQHIYLHSLNAQCLVKEYGGLENCPETISAKIIELHGVTMNEDLRQRLRYLGHLPVTCEFQVAELALRPPIVSRDTLNFFSDKIERRKKQRQKKTREEKRVSQRIQQEENKKMGIDPSAVIIRSEAASAQIGETHIVESAENTPLSSSVGSSSELLATSPRSVASSDEGGQSSSMSFAQMLRAGKAKPPKPSAAASANPQQPGGPETRRVRATDSDDTDNEDRVPVPVFQASFGDAIQRALDQYKGSDDPLEKTTSLTATPNKKKKKQKTLLFTTTMNRAK